MIIYRPILLCITLILGNHSHALDVVWQTTLPFTVFPYQVFAGQDGATSVEKDDVIFWYSPTGTLQYTIDIAAETEIATIGQESFSALYCTENSLVIKRSSYGDTSQGILIIFTLSDNILFHQTIAGTAIIDNEGTGAEAKYLAVLSGTTLTAYQKPNGLGDTSSTGISMVPNNSVVIPSSYQGNVEIMLETSNDLVEWTQALPGTYNPATSSRFFRVRAESAE